MQISVLSAADLGLAVRAARRQAGLRLDDLAAMAGVSKQFISDVEYGKPTVQLGRVLQVLAELGLPLTLDLPRAAEPELVTLRAQGGPRRRPAPSSTP